MLRPSKHSHPDQTVFALSIKLAQELKSKRLVQYDALRKFASKAAIGGDVLFLPAVHLLFLLGLTEYRAKTDAFEYSPKK